MFAVISAEDKMKDKGSGSYEVDGLWHVAGYFCLYVYYIA
jgi:hypothetical protein